jgi:uncharacterized protein (DUF2252 family)
VRLIEEQNRDRESDLIPVRHGRMAVSAFSFYRGAARIMAADLALTPITGLEVQLCGDAHLMNFGVFGSPERALLFDVNDFDETLPGPWEWDVKRLATSFTIGARDSGLRKRDVASITIESVRGYRSAMARFGQMRAIEVWYSRVTSDMLMRITRGRRRRSQLTKIIDKATRRDSLHALSRLAHVVDGEHRIVSDPPLVVPLRDMESDVDPEAGRQAVIDLLAQYRSTLRDDRRLLLDRYRLVDVARKVVGVGSVGTRCYIALLQGRDRHDPLFLQVKQATRSVLENHLPASVYANPGQRVVQGQRLMQAASDIFLGWMDDPAGGTYYWRQLRDMKGSADLSTLDLKGWIGYAQICGWSLARAHARSGDPVAIAAYVGSADDFPRAVTQFAARYADQNEADYAAFGKAIKSGRLEAVTGL